MNAHDPKSSPAIPRLTRLLNALPWPRSRAVGWLALVGAATGTLIAIGAGVGTAPSIPGINISADPLYATATVDKPSLTLALSVEFPTVGAQYVGNAGTSTDSSYSNTKEYLGYYDAESCYVYNDAPSEAPASGLSAADYKRFDRSGPATNRMCNTANASSFSGNFLNWASSSAIDMLRIALSGGDRYIDTPSLTILQRAVIPNGDPTCMWNSTNFPAKQLSRAGGTSGQAYFGAVPASMQSAAGVNDIWVANTLNRIYFGTSNTGGCGNTTAYTLGGSSGAVQKGPTSTYTGALPGGVGAYTLLGGEGSTYNFSGTKEVWFGSTSDNRWTVLPAYGGIDCYWSGGGGPYGGIPDPAPGVGKSCYVKNAAYAGAWAPTLTAALNTDGFFYARAQVCNTAAPLWVSGTTYAIGDIRNSPAHGANYTRKTAGGGTTDPQSDTANWQLGPGGLQDNRDATAFVSNAGLCVQYPNGNYKPAGAIQRYSDQLRVAAFGYLMDQTASGSGGRYGGVLRAPMKYVGAKTYDINGQNATNNSAAEWDSSTGVFAANPDGDTTQTPNISGVINYLNKFGRTGPTPGRYKMYDPVGELYYESLRYLQGLAPSADAISGLSGAGSAALYDGFPVYTSWTDPYGGGRSNTADYSCVKSNIVVIGDIHTWDGNRVPSASAANNIPDINYWTGIVRAFENNSTGTSYLDGQGVSRNIANPNPANGSSPSAQIMGAAYWAHTHDIRGTGWTNGTGPARQRPGLRIKTFIFDVNEYAEENVDSQRRQRNQFFMAAKYGGFESQANAQGNPYNTKGNPFYRDDGTADNNVWQDFQAPGSSVPARVSPNDGSLGEANTYYLQSSARGVLSAFNEIFQRSGSAARTIAGVAVQSKRLTTSDAIYQGAFDTSDWSGELYANAVSLNGSNTLVISQANTWSAAARMSAASNPAGTRNIVVGRSGGTANPTAVAFTWAAIDASLQTNLGKLTPASADDGYGQFRLNYLRGDQTKEATGSTPLFRTRTKLLGDIINSGVVYSGTPTLAITGSSYQSFYSTNSGRTPAVFVGANDGMLHAFNANTGDELFGYIPSWMGPKLAALTSPNYANNHQLYVDGSSAVGEAQTASNGNAADWKTVLVGSTGGGGRGVFALDVTNPASFNASKVMWEFTQNDDPDMGYVMGKPAIVKVRTNGPSGAPTYRWFAAVASGVNTYVQPNSSSLYGDGTPAIFLLALDKAVGVAWSAGTNYYKISVPVDSTLSATLPTGVINFAPVFNTLTGEMYQMYFGDLHGKVWKLDFSPWATADWTMNKLSAFTTSSQAYPLYIAKNAANANQPITMSPSVIQGSGLNTRYVFFGTGKYMEIGDKSTTANQSVYMIYDNGTNTADQTPTPGPSIISGRGRLRAGTISGTTVTVTAFKWGRATTDADASQRSGWYFDYAATGERSVTDASVVGQQIVFSSIIPVASAASCTPGGGGGNRYTVDYITGNGTLLASQNGVLGSPIVFTTPTTSSSYTPSDSTGRRYKTVEHPTADPNTAGVPVVSTTVVESVAAGRLSWRQINNYLDLKNAP